MKDALMTNIKVFSAEKRDGVAEAVMKNSLSFASNIIKLNVEPEASNIFHSIASANPDQPDLIHRYSILASSGWNNNDDVFMREELFNARSTPVDKQVNYMHDELTIIGHMTESFILSQGGELLVPQTLSDLPENFDIGVGFVLYKIWEDEARAALVSKVISEIDSGNWFVSMECMFPHFDYAVIDKGGNHKVVARNEQTAFLTKYLRSYGGTGVYQDYKVGRLLRGLFFSGKGIVDNPANKRSVILHTNFSSTASNLNIREVKMDEVEKIKAELAQAKADNAKLLTEAAQKAQAQVTQEVNVAKAETATVKAELDAVKAELATTKAALATANENVVKALAEAKEEKDKADEMGKECATLKLEAVKAARIGQLVKAGLDEAKATEVYAKWGAVADEQFADIVALHTKAMDDNDEDDAEAKAKAEQEAKDKAKAKEVADLAKAEAEVKIVNTTTDNADTTKVNFETLSKSLAKLLPLASAANKSENK